MRIDLLPFAALLASCALTTSFDRYDTAPHTALYAVRGTVDGIDDGAVALALNGDGAITSGNGPFAFAATLVDGAAFRVSVASDPPRRACSIEGGAGTIAGKDATDVAVHCISTDASLVALSISAAPLTPAFTPATTTYSAAARTSAIFTTSATTTVTATAREPQATITIQGTVVTQGAPSPPLPLSGGPNPIDVTVTAADGRTRIHYTIVVSGAPNPNDYLKASNTAAYAAFGGAVALHGDTLAVASQLESSAGNLAGGVYVFTRAGTTWSQQALVHPSDGYPGANFGRAVALYGDTLAVGQENDQSVYVFTRSGTTWTEQAKLKASNARPSAYFGSAVALSQDTLAIGSSGESSSATGVNGNQSDTSTYACGAAYVFIRTNDAWSQQAYVKASVAVVNRVFGTALALSGDTLAVTAAPGLAYVFTRTGAIWAQEALLDVKASNTAGAGTVALDGDALVIGAPAEASYATGVNGSQSDMSMPGAGAAFVLTRSGTAWSQRAYVKASNTRVNANFGRSVAVHGTTLAVGAAGESSSATGVNGNQSDTSMPGAGAAYVF